MAKETMQLGEGFSATKVPGGSPPPPTPPPAPPEVKTRHYVIGYGVIAAILGALAWWFTGPGHRPPAPATMQERPGLTESLAPKKMGGVLSYDIIRAQLNLPPTWSLLAPFSRKYEQTHFGPFHNTVVNEGENVLEDCFEANTGSACTNVALWKYHGLGTSSAAINETDGGCTTELTTQYNPNSTRATGSQTNNGANIYRTVGTNTVDEAATIEEFCLMDTSTGAGDIWTHILTGTIVLLAADAVQTTYDLTIE